uniref:Uncharacterized protein n=1 Tax=Davidia involucrata TaxID=16924 RepID=A0A5B6YM72_DAVIN
MKVFASGYQFFELETIKYVENQLQTVGADVKEFCAEVVHDVLSPFLVDSMKGAAPDLSLEHAKDTDLVAHETSNICVEDDPKKGLCNVNSLPHPSFVEPAEGVHIDSSLKRDAEIGIYNKSNTGVEGYLVVEKSFPSDILEAVTLAEKDSSMTSSLCGVNQSNHEEGWNGQVNLSPKISVEWCNNSMKEEEITNLVNTAADISSALPSTNSIILVQSCEPDSGLTSPGNALSAESIDTSTANVTVPMVESSWTGFELLCDELAKTEGFISLADSGAEEASDDHVIELDLETTQPYNKLNLEESCIVVDSNEFCSISLTTAKHHHKKKIWKALASKMKLAKGQECEQAWYKVLDAGSSQQEGESFTPSRLPSRYESVVSDCCEFEWEII